MGVVENCDLNDLGLTWAELKDFLGLLLAECASLLPALFALEVPLLAALLHLLLPILGAHLVTAHLGHEFFHHFTEGLVILACIALTYLADEIFDHVTEASATGKTSTSATTTTTSTSAVVTTAGEVLHHLVNEMHGVLGLFLLNSGFFFI